MLEHSFTHSVIAVDPQGRIVMVSPEAEQLLGLSGWQSSQTHSGLLPTQLEKAIAETLASGQGIAGRRFVFSVPKKEERVFSISTIALAAQRSAGNVAVVAILTDLTMTLKLDASLQRLNRLAGIGTLSASMAHEIKNALVAIKTFVDILGKQKPQAELAAIVMREIERINSIVGQMLKFAGASSPNLTRVRLHDVLEQALRLIQHQITEKGVVVERAFSAESDLVHGDAYQLEQAFLNLFLNALAAMTPGGKLRVTTETFASPARSENGAGLRIVVADTGSGVRPEIMDRLFEPFFTTKAEGTGLGLSITRRIIQEHAGRIDLQSTLGKGTEFRIELPVLKHDPGGDFCPPD